VASTVDTHDGSAGDQPFKVEQRGIDYVPESERWATPRNIGALWAGRRSTSSTSSTARCSWASGSASPRRSHHHHRQHLVFCCWAGVAAGARDRHHGLHDLRAPFGTHGSRLLSLLQLDHPVGLRDRGPDPHRRRRHRALPDGRLPHLERRSQGRLHHPRRGHPGRDALPRVTPPWSRCCAR
jgi:hypothetical protein